MARTDQSEHNRRVAAGEYNMVSVCAFLCTVHVWLGLPVQFVLKHNVPTNEAMRVSLPAGVSTCKVLG